MRDSQICLFRRRPDISRRPSSLLAQRHIGFSTQVFHQLELLSFSVDTIPVLKSLVKPYLTDQLSEKVQWRKDCAVFLFTVSQIRRRSPLK